MGLKIVAYAGAVLSVIVLAVMLVAVIFTLGFFQILNAIV